MAELDNNPGGGDFGPDDGAAISSSPFDPSTLVPTGGSVLINNGSLAGLNNNMQPGQYALLQNNGPISDGSGIPLRLQSFLSGPPAVPVMIPSESHSADGGQEISCLWDTVWLTRKAWVDSVMGSSVISGSSISRTIPEQCPEPGYWHLYAADCALTALMNENADWRQNPSCTFPILLSNATNTSTLTAQGGTTALSTGPGQGVQEDQGVTTGTLVNNNIGGGQGPLTAVIPWPMHVEGPPNIGPGLARYKVSYRKRPYMVRTDAETAALQSQYPNTPAEMLRYCERTSRQSLQAQTFAPGSLVFLDSGQVVPDNAAYVLQPTEALRYILHEWPGVPYMAWDNCLGMVNSGMFDGAPGFPTYQPETLLMQAPQRELYEHTNGIWYWRIIYEFLYRPTGWNQMLKNDGQYHPVGYKVNQAKLFTPVDFNQLFQPEGAQPLM